MIVVLFAKFALIIWRMDEFLTFDTSFFLNVFFFTFVAYVFRSLASSFWVVHKISPTAEARFYVVTSGHGSSSIACDEVETAVLQSSQLQSSRKEGTDLLQSSHFTG